MRPEISVDHKYFMENIEKLGWKNITNSYPDLKEHSISPSYIIEEELDKKIKEINRDIFDKLSNGDINKILNEIKRKIQNSTLSEFSNYIKHGITVENPADPSTLLNIKLIDYDNLSKNSFIYAHELRFKGIKSDEPDFTLFINGIPLVLAEIKSEALPDSVEEALKQLSRYEEEVPELAKIVHIGLAIGMKKGYVPIFPNYNHESRVKNLQVWKVNGKENIYNLLDPKVLLNFIKYYVFVLKQDNNYFRIAARYNQYFAGEKAFERIKEYLDGRSNKNKGLIWHWLGSGKTYTMFFIAYRFLLNYSDRFPIVFMVVDRKDLERQHIDSISKIDDYFLNQYKNINLINSINQLHDIIRQIKESEFNISKSPPRGIYIVTIQKFQKGDIENEEREGIINLLCELKDEYLNYLKTSNPLEYERIMSRLSELNDKAKIEECIKLGASKKMEILFLIDEAHRSQYGSLASVRKLAFPKAISFGFTGTPIFRTDYKDTIKEFSYPELNEYYLDAYFINNSIEDGFTLKIIYKSITEGKDGIKFKLDEKTLKEYIDEYLKREKDRGEDISEYLEGDVKISDDELKRVINQIKVFLLNPNRIDALAKYIAESILVDTQTIDFIKDLKDLSKLNLSKFKFKAMIVMANRKACVLMKRALDKHLVDLYGEQARNWSEIVMTYKYNESDQDIKQYMEELRKKYGINDFDEINKIIQDNFKNLPDPRILIVTDMLITGFDAPQLRVMYLDKPIYGHKLLQAIGRVNRPAPGKESGLVVDSIGLLSNLRDTLNNYNLLLSQDDRILNGLKEVLKDEESEETSFKAFLEEIKKELKSLKVNNEDLSIDLDELRNDIKRQENWVVKYEDKIKKIAFYYDLPNIRFVTDIDENIIKELSHLKVLVNKLAAIVKFYNSLSPSSAASAKIIYKEDIETIKILLRLIYKYLGKNVSRKSHKLLEEILDLIYSKSEVSPFNEDDWAIIDKDFIRDIDKIEEKESNDNVYAFFMLITRKITNDDSDPFYKKILEILDKLKMEWITRKQSTKDVLEKLKTIYNQILEYSEKITKMNKLDKILYSLKYTLIEEFGNSCNNISFNNLRKCLERIEEVISNKSPKDAEYYIISKKSELTINLISDIYENCRNTVDIIKAAEYVRNQMLDDLKSQIMRWLYGNNETE
jgi:type I restriction enzyme R subunit